MVWGSHLLDLCQITVSDQQLAVHRDPENISELRGVVARGRNRPWFQLQSDKEERAEFQTVKSQVTGIKHRKVHAPF